MLVAYSPPLYSTISILSITKKGEIESTSAPRVILVINVNISLVGLILSSSIFQIIPSGMDKRMWNPFKMLRTKDWLKLKDLDSTFSILVIQDHIESIGKANTIKEG